MAVSLGTRVRAQEVVPEGTAARQHTLLQSVLLHLFPGVALTLFVLVVAPVLTDRGYPGVLALFIVIGVVIAPLELGYLLYQARRTTGTWNLLAVVDYRERLPRRTYLKLGLPLIGWWVLMLLLFVPVIDPWLTDTAFGWYPETIREFASFEDDASLSTAATVTLLVIAFASNGFLGPVVEELYFRGYLLPRMAHLGRWAPVLHTVLFSVYHLWSPWQNLGRILALLPWVTVVWRTRSLALSLVVHMAVNNLFLLLILAVFLD